MNDSKHPGEKFAIVGMSCLFPGASTPDAFWNNLINGVNSTSQATEEEFGADPALYYDPQRRTHDTTYSLRGGYIRNAVEIPAGMDKVTGWSLYAAREALQQSGVLNRNDLLTRCGLILGTLSFPTQESHVAIAPIHDEPLEQALGQLLDVDGFMLPRQYGESGNPLRSPAAVVAQTLNLGGTHFCIDAACASSLYAVGLACEMLSAGKADLMLAGAVSAADPLFVNMGFAQFGAHSENGESRPLDQHSEGLIPGEGAGMLVLKRYADAVRDGDEVYAVVAGIGLSNDGKGKHPLTPNPRGQIMAFQRAYASGIDPRTVQYVECHASGTALGDKTELNSMDTFFGAVGATPRIGSVKANQGHLLTAAGVASLLKVILSMRHGQIPATIGVQDPLTSRRFGAAQLVSQNTVWSQSEKVAGVNAFGFGGVSAHMVLQNPQAAGQPVATNPKTSRVPLAIVGMEAQFGGVDSLDVFAQTLFDGTQHFKPLPPKRWKGLAEDAPPGAYIDSFEIDFLRFKFPPKEDEQPTPQHLLLLKVADKAVQDAGLQNGGNVAVIVALGTELSLHQSRSRLDLSHQIRDALANAGVVLDAGDRRALEGIAKDAISPPSQVNQYTSFIGNIVSSRVSALWDFSGSAFTLTSGENSVYKALDIAQILLANDELDAVVIGAVDLAGGVENVGLWQAQQPANSGALTMSFDQKATGWQIGEGAGAVVLKRADKAANQRVYATIESIAVVPGDDANAVVRAGKTALDIAGVNADDIGYLEASASGFTAQDEAEIVGLNQLYTLPVETPTIALGSVKTNIGHTGAAAGISSLIKTALCLYQRFIPGTPNWTAPKLPDMWGEHPRFYVPSESRTWFSGTGALRYAAVSGISGDGTAAHIVLSDAGVTHETQAESRTLKNKALHLFPIDADNLDGLLGRLRQFEAELNAGETLPSLAYHAFATFGSGHYVVALVGSNADGLRKEVTLALKGIPEAFERGNDWFTPAGSAFSPKPFGEDAGVAFVYPGAFNSYPGIGQEWMHLFPDSHDHLSTISTHAGEQMSETMIYERLIHAPTRADVREQRARFSDDQAAMMITGSSFAVSYTYVMREVFKVKPDMVFGYSLGEGSTFWAMGAWRDANIASKNLRETPLFKTRLVGRKDAVREAWGLPEQTDNRFWASFVLTASPQDVAAVLSRTTHVYITHINTPNELVIAGEPEACERVIAELACGAVRAPFESVIHNEVILSEYEAFYQLHRLPIYSTPQDVIFYSAADYEPAKLDSDLVARNIARVSCKPVDFPRLVNRAYRDGARIFVELGPGSTCTRWIGDTLRAENAEHLAVSIDNLRLDSHSALIKLLARLVSHRIPLDLSVLYDKELAADKGRQLLRTITLGGEPIRDVILSETNRQRFAGVGEPVEAAAMESVAVGAQPIRMSQAEGAPQPHDAFLQSRLTGLREIGAALRAQVGNPTSATPIATPAVSRSVPVTPPSPPKRVLPRERYTPRPAIFDTASIDQFARGSIKACFGPEYAIYDDKRAPRIPNTDLMLISRLVEVNATRLITKTGSSMVAEYDVPIDMWFYNDNSYPFTPYSMLMEMALQPCGFLSAFMGPTLAFPDIDFYFRNLDGQGKLLREVDLRGRTLVNKVVLVSSTILQGIIIQKYTFEMILDGEPFYVGSSTFGYFTLQSLSSQAGLDMGKPPVKWHEANPDTPLLHLAGNRQGVLTGESAMTLPRHQLAFMDDVMIAPGGGKNGQGYSYATSLVHPSNWFFACHFHDDPVMPGSLGLETITQAIQAYAIQSNLTGGMKSPRFGHVENNELTWKYRGQVLGDSDSVNVEVHITRLERVNGVLNIYADASLWKGALRLYEFKNVGVAITEAEY